MINVTKIESEGGVCPYQVEGRTDDNRPVYARYRHGWLRIEVGQPGVALTDWKNDTILSKEITPEDEGRMSYSELKEHTKGQFEWCDYPQAQNYIPPDSEDYADENL